MTRRIAWITALLPTIGQLAAVFYLPALPLIALDLHARPRVILASLTLYLLAYGYSQLLGGTLSDRFGRKPVVLWGLMLSCVGTVLCAVTPNVALLMFGRLLEGKGAGITTALGLAIVNDTFRNEKLAKMLSTTGTAAISSIVIGPIIGGIIASYLGWRATFWTLFGYYLIVAMAVIILLPETRSAGRHNLWRNLKHLFGSRIFMANASLAIFSFATLFAYFVASPYLFQTVLSWTTWEHGYTFIATGVGIILGIILSRRLPILFAQAILLAGPTALILTPTTPAGILFPAFATATAVGLLYPRTLAAALAPFKEVAGAASALVGFGQMTLSAAAVVTISLITITHQKTVAIALLVLASAGIALYQLIRQTSE